MAAPLDDQYKREVGRVIVWGTAVYCLLITLSMFAASWCGKDILGPVKDVLMVILGWWLAKSSTIIDHEWGTSRGSEEKSLMMKGIIEEKSKKLE